MEDLTNLGLASKLWESFQEEISAHYKGFIFAWCVLNWFSVAVIGSSSFSLLGEAERMPWPSVSESKKKQSLGVDVMDFSFSILKLAFRQLATRAPQRTLA